MSGDGDGQVTSYEHVPAGDVQVRRGEHVHAIDGLIGRVQGLVVHPGDHRVTHVLLDEGHLWGLKQVAIPIGSVTGVDDGVRLDLTKDQVRDLPPVELDDQNRPRGQCRRMAVSPRPPASSRSHRLGTAA
jgi:hypothetical protein